MKQVTFSPEMWTAINDIAAQLDIEPEAVIGKGIAFMKLSADLERRQTYAELEDMELNYGILVQENTTTRRLRVH